MNDPVTSIEPAPRAAHRYIKFGALAGALGVLALTFAACSSGNGNASANKSGNAATAASSQTVDLSMIVQSDASSGAPGTFTSKHAWPAFAPSDVSVPAGATVNLTIKVYDAGNTALPDGSPYNAVAGGTETVNGSPVTTVDNAHIAHTFTIPALGINVPLPVATDGSSGAVTPTTVVFTFTAPKTAGAYVFQCMTPCGTGADGTGGAMATFGWMKGHLKVT